MKIGMIGGKTSTLGFRALGVETFAVIKPPDAPDVWRTINLRDFGIIFMTEPIYEVLSEEVKALQEQDLPVITIIPPVAGGKGIAQGEIRSLVEKAVGTDLIFRE